MSLGTPYIPDRLENSHAPGAIGLDTPAQVIAQFGAGNVKTASKDFVIHFRGSPIHFRKNIPVVCSAELIAALTAANAPVS